MAKTAFEIRESSPTAQQLGKRFGTKGRQWYVKYMTTAMRRLGKKAEEYGKEEAPVRTGFLQSEIKIGRSNHLRTIVKSDAPYSSFQEYGTRYHGANPYMTRALTRLEQDISVELTEVADKMSARFATGKYNYARFQKK